VNVNEQTFGSPLAIRQDEFQRKTNLHLQAVLDAFPFYVMLVDADHYILFTNRAILRDFGLKQKEVIGRYCPKVIHKRRSPFPGCPLEDAVSESRAIEKEIYDKQTDRWIISGVYPTGIKLGNKNRVYLHFIQDISERKRAEKELGQSEAKYRALVQNIPCMVYRGKKDWSVEIISKSLDISGYRPEDFWSHRVSWMDIIHPDDIRNTMQEAKHLKRERKDLIQKYRIIREDGGVRWVEDHKTSLFKNGTFQGVDGVVFDITDRKRAETELEESRNKMERYSEHLQTALEEERKEIAQEIHDDLGQLLTALKIDLYGLSKKLQVKSESLDNKIKDMTELIDRSIVSAKKICSDLRPAVLDDFGLPSALKWQAEEFRKCTGIRCRLRMDLSRRIPDDSRCHTAVFRIFQEALTNVSRHSHAQTVKASLHIRKDELILKVKDDGIGINQDKNRFSHSYGILGMQERARQLGGEVRVSSIPSGGTTVTAVIPFTSCVHASQL
jgi:two-component system sensor histidine kinase UhpB